MATICLRSSQKDVHCLKFYMPMFQEPHQHISLCVYTEDKKLVIFLFICNYYYTLKKYDSKTFYELEKCIT